LRAEQSYQLIEPPSRATETSYNYPGRYDRPSDVVRSFPMLHTVSQAHMVLTCRGCQQSLSVSVFRRRACSSRELRLGDEEQDANWGRRT